MVIPQDSIGPLIKTVFFSIFQVLLLCVAGYILAGKGILDKGTQRQLNKLNVSLFTPALLFSKVAFFLTPEKLRELWIIPFLFILVTLLSMGVAFLLGWLFKLKRSQRSFAMAAAMFMNSNSLPIALMQSLVVTVPGLKWGSDDNKNAMLGRALTYLVVYSTLGQVVRWSYGVRLLSQADDEAVEQDENHPLLDSSDSEDGDHTQHASPSSPRQTIPYHSPPPMLTDEPLDMNEPLTIHSKPVARPNFLRPSATRRSSTFYRSFPNSPNQSREDLPAIPSETTIGGDSDDDALPTHTASGPKYPRLRKLRNFFKHVYHSFMEFMTVPLWAAVASLVVACIEPLQHTLAIHLTPIKGAIAQAGNCSIPVTLIVLGGYFYAEEGGAVDRKRRMSMSLYQNMKEMFGFSRKRSRVHSSNPTTAGETKTIVIAVLSRMVVVPLLMSPIMAVAAYFDYQQVFADPVFVLSNVLLISSPPALTLAQITQAASGDSFERLISRTIFWSYCIVTPFTTVIYVVLGMVLASL